MKSYAFLVFLILLDWAIVFGVYFQFFAQKSSVIYLLYALIAGVVLSLINVWLFRKVNVKSDEEKQGE